MKLTTMHSIPALILGAAATLMLAACGDNNSSGDGDDTTGGGGSSAGGPGAGTAGGVELKTDLPKEVIEGSPKPKGVPNLMPETKKFPTFLVPEGTVLLSKGKEVTSSDDFPIIGEPSLVTDGEKETGEGYFLELIEDTQWIQIDLGESHPLYAILVWHFHAQKRAYHDVIVQLSDDPEFGEGVQTIYNNDYDDSSGMGKGKDRPYLESRYGLLVNPEGKSARYVRLYSNGNTTNAMNHYIEVEVYGKPGGGEATE